jgi:hypothetical protein
MPWSYRDTLARLATPAAGNMMDTAWPKRIDSGHVGYVPLRPDELTFSIPLSGEVFGRDLSERSGLKI